MKKRQVEAWAFAVSVVLLGKIIKMFMDGDIIRAICLLLIIGTAIIFTIRTMRKS